MYVLVPLAAPVVLLGIMGMAWVETHLLPPLGPPSQAQALPVPARDTLTVDPPERPQRPQVVPRCAREPAPGLRTAHRGRDADRRRPQVRAHPPAARQSGTP